MRPALAAGLFSVTMLIRDFYGLFPRHLPNGNPRSYGARHPKTGIVMSTFRSLSSMDSARAPAISAQECRSYCAQCMTLGMEPNLSLQRAAILSEMVRSWTTLANQMDRYEAILQDECG